MNTSRIQIRARLFCLLYLDCVQQVGIKDGSLPDENFSASASYPGWEAHHARLGGKGWFVPYKTNADKEWLQINLGKVNL